MRNYHIVLCQFSWSLIRATKSLTKLFLLACADSLQKDFFRLMRAEVGKRVDILGHRGGEEQVLAAWQIIQNSLERLFESHFEHHISLIKHQHLQIVGLKAISLLKMLKQPAWSTDQNIHLADSFLFVLHVLSSDDQSHTHLEFFGEGVEHFEDLHC